MLESGSDVGRAILLLKQLLEKTMKTVVLMKDELYLEKKSVLNVFAFLKSHKLKICQKTQRWCFFSFCFDNIIAVCQEDHPQLASKSTDFPKRNITNG